MWQPNVFRQTKNKGSKYLLNRTSKNLNMNIVKVKCLNCKEITSVLKDILIPYQGKVISVKCSNPACNKPMKVQVPEFNKNEGIKTLDIADFPPTQIVVQYRSQLSSAKIRVLKNDKTEEQIFDLKVGINTIGRMSFAENISIPDIPIFTIDKLISRNCHCEILVHKKEYFLEVILRDKTSKNGTFLPGYEKPLNHEDEIYLKDKDIFIIGETKIQLELG